MRRNLSAYATTPQIIGTGSYIPEIVKKNLDFQHHNFYTKENTLIETEAAVIAQKFQDITGIAERRYVTDDMRSSDIAFEAAKLAIEDSGIDPETLSQIIIAHNFGDVNKHSNQTDNVPVFGRSGKTHAGHQKILSA